MKYTAGYVLGETILKSHQNDWNFVDRGGKIMRPFAACSFVRLRGGRAKLERKDFTGGPAKRVRMGRIGAEGLCDFRRGLGILLTIL